MAEKDGAVIELADQDGTIVSFTADDFINTDKPYEYLIGIQEKKTRAVRISQFKKIARPYGINAETFDECLKDAARRLIANDRNNAAQMTDFSGLEKQMVCTGYYCNDKGVYKESPFGPVCVIPHPLLPTKRIVNIETKELKLELSFRRGKDEWERVVAPREQIASAQKIIGLAGRNVAVNSENAREVVKYIAELENSNYDSINKGYSISHMGWLPDGQFMPYTNNVSFDGEGAEYRKIYDDLTTPAGSEEAWMEIAREVRSGSSVPCRIALAAGFAAPLVKQLDALSFIVHFWGDSGCGKTVGLMMAASIWGNPEIGGILKLFSGTKNSIELQAAFCCNLPVLLDDLKLQDNKSNIERKGFDDIIYMLCAGANKGRATRNAELRYQGKWRTCTISNSEAPILQEDSAQGTELRTIEINFKNIKFFRTDERAREVAILLGRNYGFAGRKFIDAVQKIPHDDLMAMHKKFQSKLPPDNEIDAKLTVAAAILLTADAIATAAIFKDGNALTASEIEEFLTRKEEANENVRAYRALQEWVDINKSRLDPSTENKGEFWGTVEDGILYIYSDPLLKALKGRSYKPFLNWAKDNHKLKYDTGDKKRLTTQKVMRPNEKKQRCYAIAIEDQNIDPDGLIMLNKEETPDDLPF